MVLMPTKTGASCRHIDVDKRGQQDHDDGTDEGDVHDFPLIHISLQQVCIGLYDGLG